MARVISDAGPLIALAKIDALFIPRDLFARIRIPEAVWIECREKPGEDSRRIEQAAHEGWLEVVSVASGRAARPQSLGPGEGEAIQLALETENALLIMDDRLARREAMRHGLSYIGTARMLYMAERRSLIDDAAVVVQHMAACGYRISPLLLQQLRARHGANEPSGSAS
ncbi:MAG: hypothetical protein OXJ90_22440 [Spirochaetaceae bacterium]|nr:hypothetical protein [Spirochaetaceae bacterium]